MAESYSFFNSKNGDRKYNARNWADYFAPLFKSGVFNGNLQVVANGSMSVKINKGYAWIDGYMYHLDAPLVLDLETASGNMNRKDNIVIRLDLTNRWVRAFVVTGAYYSKAAVPPAPEISTTIHEIVIGRISVAAGTTKITQDMIEDTRMDSNLCGWVCGTVKQIEFEQIYEQFTAFQKKKEEETLTWMDACKEWTNKFQDDASSEFTEWEKEKKEAFEVWYSAFKKLLSSKEADFDEWINSIKDTLTSVENGELLLKLNQMIDDMRTITSADIEAIINGSYVDDDDDSSIFYETASDSDIEEIINGTYVGVDDDSDKSATEDKVIEIANKAFK